MKLSRVGTRIDATERQMSRLKALCRLTRADEDRSGGWFVRHYRRGTQFLS